MTADLISSPQNPRVKHFLALQQKSALRRAEGRFVVEGRREVGHCVAAGLEVETLFCCPELAGGEGGPAVGLGPAAQRLQVTPAVYARMAYRGQAEGVLAVVKTPPRTLEGLPLGENPLVVVLEGVEKPGNLGAVLRSADAAGVDAVIVCDPLTDLYNPNLVRASLGALFTVPTAVCTSEACIRFLKQRGIRILTAQLQDSALYYRADMTRPTALVMGTEATGLTTPWRTAADAHIRIPMLGRLDSLNVSVSAAVLIYEAVRQRAGQ